MSGTNEGQLLLISMLEHFSYCQRQFALIHLEDSYRENLYTIRGNWFHRKVDQPGPETRKGIPLERSLVLWSDRLGLTGKADVVEFHDNTPFPVEYKSGAIRQDPHADLQLAAQAICLEEMYQTTVKAGAIYHIASRKRREVQITAELKQRVSEICDSIRSMLESKLMPEPVNDHRCIHCSLKPVCLPELSTLNQRIQESRQHLFHPVDSGGASE